jgi:hypothetical protein
MSQETHPIREQNKDVEFSDDMNKFSLGLGLAINQAHSVETAPGTATFVGFSIGVLAGLGLASPMLPY